LKIEKGTANISAPLGGEIDSVYLIVFNEYKGEYPSGNLGEKAEIEFEIQASLVKSKLQLTRVEPGYALNRPGQISLFGDNLDEINSVRIGAQKFENFKKQTKNELILEYEQFAQAGWKDLYLNTDSVSLKKKDELRVFAPVKEGKLVRGEFSSRLYVVKNNYRRHIGDMQIINMYPHLSVGEIQILKPRELELYKVSSLVRPAGKERVYQIDAQGQKHWLDLSAQEFEKSGRNWGSVYIISREEAQFYPEAQPITS
jgi:hypothetical protein